MKVQLFYSVLRFWEVRAASDGCNEALGLPDAASCHSQLVLRYPWWLGHANEILCDHHHRLGQQ